jgi:hypothetical protein
MLKKIPFNSSRHDGARLRAVCVFGGIPAQAKLERGTLAICVFGAGFDRSHPKAQPCPSNFRMGHPGVCASKLPLERASR